MRLPVLIFCAVSMAFATPVPAADAPPETSIQIYHVSDLAAYTALHETASLQRVPGKEWRQEHAETVESLNRLALLVRSMCSSDSAVVEPHRESLSLVVRHTADGHREIEQFLQALRNANGSLIRVRCQPLGDRKSLPENEQKRAEELLGKQVLTPDEVQEVREWLTEPDYAAFDRTVTLMSGRKTSWGPTTYHATMTACIAPDGRTIRLRVDFVLDNGVGTSSDQWLITSQLFDVPEGSSVMLPHGMGDADLVWLISPTIIDPSGEGHAGVQTTATK